MQSLLRRYKSAERAVYKKISAAIIVSARRGLAGWLHFVRGGSQSVSILVVTHDEAPPRGIRVSLFGLAGMAMLGAAIVIMAFAFTTSLGGERARARVSNARLTEAQGELDALEAQTSRLSGAFRDFQAALEPIVVKDASIEGAKAAKPPVLSVLFVKRMAEARSLAEIRARLDQTAPVIAEYGSMLGQMDSIKETVPAIWPIAGDIGHISTTFGNNLNPFTGQNYFHTGIDCSTYRSGDLIDATADGKVIFAGVEGGYGRCVIIAHAYGYMTRYGHMERILVHSGQAVRQGQAIGVLGNTGLSTGPHTHYEVIMGRGYLDPTDYLWEGAHSHPIITGGGYSE